MCLGCASAVLLGLHYPHQAMKVWGHARGRGVMLADGDLVSETNCVRQPFASADVGLNKAVVLINRVNLFWGPQRRHFARSLHGMSSQLWQRTFSRSSLAHQEARSTTADQQAKPRGRIEPFIPSGR